jgi:hypothetical protein
MCYALFFWQYVLCIFFDNMCYAFVNLIMEPNFYAWYAVNLQFIHYMYHLRKTTWCTLNTSCETQRSLLPEEQSSSLWRDMEEHTLGSFADVWLSCDSNSEALSLACRLLSLRLINVTWIGVFPSSMLTTNDIDGLRVADVFVHKNAKLSILMASSVEYLEPWRLGSTNSKIFPCSWRS